MLQILAEFEKEVGQIRCGSTQTQTKVVGLESDFEDQNQNCRKPKQMIQNQAREVFSQCREKKQRLQKNERKDV